MIFSNHEMECRAAALIDHMNALDLEAVFLHTADNVYYIGGVPLLSAWGRPMWAVLDRHGKASLIGAQIEKENMQSGSWIKDVRIYGDRRNVWEASLELVIESLGSPYGKGRRIGVEIRQLTLDIYHRLKAALPGDELVEISPALEQLRIVKSKEEIALLTLGGELAKIGANAFLDALAENTTEITVASHAVHEMNKALGALYPAGATSSYAYCQIGDHTLTPHLHPTGRRLKRGDLVALNVFPVIWGYCMELERTFVYGTPNDRQSKALAAVDESFQAAKAAVRPGARFSEVDALASSILEKHGFAKFIRHGTGHAHGIMIGPAGREETGELRSYNTGRMSPNMINSVEPGIYLPDLGGFRHSDVMLLLEDATTCLTDFPIPTQ